MTYLKLGCPNLKLLLHVGNMCGEGLIPCPAPPPRSPSMTTSHINNMHSVNTMNSVTIMNSVPALNLMTLVILHSMTTLMTPGSKWLLCFNCVDDTAAGV